MIREKKLWTRNNPHFYLFLKRRGLMFQGNTLHIIWPYKLFLLSKALQRAWKSALCIGKTDGGDEHWRIIILRAENRFLFTYFHVFLSQSVIYHANTTYLAKFLEFWSDVIRENEIYDRFFTPYFNFIAGISDKVKFAM